MTQNQRKPLLKLIVDSNGFIQRTDRESDRRIDTRYQYFPVIGSPEVFVVQNPGIIDDMIADYHQRGSVVIPKFANAYCASEFNGGAQFIRKDAEGKEKMFSCYAVQFYNLWDREE